jgi:competence protein ComFC
VNHLTFIDKLFHTYILDLILPEVCLGCKIKGEIICSNCLLKIKRAERETCEGILACFDYRDPLIKKAIWDLKYHNRFIIGQKLGKVLCESFLEDIADLKIYTKGGPILVIPVPLYNSRQKKRGYNQAKIIADSFCKSSEKEILKLMDNVVIKQINTEQQAKLTNRSRRIKNIRGAFKIINNEKVKGQTIIIIDDVTTTGGTITEIIKILKKSGAKKVIGLTVAH